MSNAISTAGLTDGLARRSSALAFGEIPADVAELSRQTLLDWFGVALAGSREPAPLALLDAVGPGDPGDRSSATVVGRGERLGALHAALVNGTASHALDYDDMNLSFLGHASVAVGAAALALAEVRNAHGEELLSAFLAGYETACRLAVALGPEPYLRGHHYTGTIGTFGAAAACARLLGLDPARTAVAFGVAASSAAALKCNFGTMTKPLHAGRACESGMLAALLAEHGFSANAAAIEAEQGFAALAGGSCHPDAALAEPPHGWFIRENLFKYHAACFFTHSAIECIRGLRDSAGFSPEEVERVTLHVSEVELGTCSIAEPANALEVKFSIAQLAAMSLLGRDTAVICDEDARDAEVIALRERVRLAEDGAAGEPTRVEVELADGAVLAGAHDVREPERDLPAQRERLERKFASLAEPVIGARAAGELRALVSCLDASVRVREVMAAAAR